MNAGSHKPQVRSVRESQGMAGDLTALLSGYLGRTIFSLGTAVLLARLLSPDELAPYSLFQMCTDLAVTFGGTWTASALVRFGREELLQSGSMHRTSSARLAVSVSLLVALAIGGMVFGPQLSRFIGLPPFVIGLLAVSILSVMGTDFTIGVLQTTGEFRRTAVLQTLQKGAFFGGILVLFMGWWQASALIVVVLLMFSNLIGFVVALFRLPWRSLRPIAVSQERIRPILAYSAPFLVSAVSLTVINWVDLAVINGVVGAAGVGTYHMAYMGFNVLVGVGFTFNALFMPKIVSLRLQEKTDAVNLYGKLALPLALLGWSIVLTATMIVLPAVVPMVLGDRYAGVVSPATVLLIGAFLSFASSGLSSIITAYDLIVPVQAVNLATAVLNILLDLLFVPLWGIVGAAWATVIAFALNVVGCLWVARLKVHVFSGAWLVALCAIMPGVALAIGICTGGMAVLLFAVYALSVVTIVRIRRLLDPNVILMLDLVELPAVVSSPLRRVLQWCIRS